MMTATNNEAWIFPAWPAPDGVRALVTTRVGGVSQGVYASLNLGAHVGDEPAHVAVNRARLRAKLDGRPVWLNQVHGTRAIDAAHFVEAAAPPEADAAFTRRAGVVCTVLTADCLPVLLCDAAGTVVAAAHAGWRGLAAGVLEETMAAMGVPGGRILAWLGPAIGPQAFEVGDEVRAAFVAHSPRAATAFKATATPGKWLADLYALARQRLAEKGVERVYGGSFCTVNDKERFFSWRRDGPTGRMAAMVWLAVMFQ